MRQVAKKVYATWPEGKQKVFTMSYDDGIKLIESITNIDVIWVYPDGTVKMTDGIVLSTE